MNDREAVRANGGSSDAEAETFDSIILRTFSTVKPRMMAQFMTALTWQAAWLRRFFHWDRMVAGYTLTDIPVRVMEIYGIPLLAPEGSAA